MQSNRHTKQSKLKSVIGITFCLLIISIVTVILCQNIFPKPIKQQEITDTTKSSIEIKSEEPIKPMNPTLKDPSLPTAKSIPILMYHFFYDSSAGGTGEDGNFIDTEVFEQHIKYLVDNKYYFPTWDEVKQYIAGSISLPEKSIVITDDDGSGTFFSLAVPILTKYKVPVTSFLITSWTDPKSINTDRSLVTFMSHSHDMHQGGCEGGHGGLFRCLDHDKAVADLITSKNITGGGDVFCYPFGDYTDQAIQELKDAGFSLAVTTEYSKAEPGMNPLLLPRIRISQSTDINSFVNAIN